MDRFIVVKQKKNENFTGREDLLNTLRYFIESNSMICVYGNSGVGKTCIVQKALEGTSFIHYSPDVAERIRGTSIHVVIDETDIPEERPLSKGACIVISKKIVEGFDCVYIPPLEKKNLIELGMRQFPDLDIEFINRQAELFNGNIRSFLFSLDKFEVCSISSNTQKEFMYELLCKNGNEDPRKYIGSTITEHGFSWGIVHENYTDSQNSIEWCAMIANYMSLAAIEDDRIYHNFSSTSIFSLLGIVIPAIEINHTLERSLLRPGSSWTKFNNFKMRYNRYQTLTNRKSRVTMDVDSLMVIYQHCKLDPIGSIELLKAYGFEAADVDMMNHLSLINKIKPRVLQNIKKQLR